jgi:hypothetical protein
MNKRKHYIEIIEWANGAQIQRQTRDFGWVGEDYPTWNSETKYRVKPKPNNFYGYVCYQRDQMDLRIANACTGNVIYTFDDETNKLIAVEMIK